MDGCQHTNTHAQQAQYTQPLPCLVCEQLGPHVLDVGARADGEEHDGQKRPEVKERTHWAASLGPAGHNCCDYTIKHSSLWIHKMCQMFLCFIYFIVWAIQNSCFDCVTVTETEWPKNK